MSNTTIVCLVGSNRFGETFDQVDFAETVGGRIVLRIEFDLDSDDNVLAAIPEEECDAVREELRAGSFRKIDMADEIVVINVGGFVGNFTKELVQYAKKHKKPVRYLETPDKRSAMRGIAILGAPRRM